MRRRTVTLQPIVRIATLAVLAALLSGCSTYYQSYYPDSGVYYGASAGYGHAGGHSSGGYATINPSVYPYWSIDHFYFSRYYHPYSVYVGYHEPLYYPYPGWVFGDYRSVHPRGFHSVAFGFGYPWHGYGYRYPGYSFGFFSGYDPFYRGAYYRHSRDNRHRIRHIDRRLEALQHENVFVDRRALTGRDRFAVGARQGSSRYPAGRDINLQNRSGNRIGNLAGDRGAARERTRADVLRQRDAISRGRLIESRGRTERRIERNSPAVRSGTRPARRSAPVSTRGSNRDGMDRSALRREGARASSQAHRGIPIENLRGRSVGDPRPNRSISASRGESSANVDTRGIGRAPSTDRRPGTRQSRQPEAPAVRPGRTISRPDPPSRRSSTPTRRGVLRGGSRSGENRAHDGKVRRGIRRR